MMLTRTGGRTPTGRMWAYIGLLLGGGTSIAANVAHSFVPPAAVVKLGAAAVAEWSPEYGAVVAAVVWPVALFVAIEILSKPAWPSGWRWNLLRFGGLTPVAGVAAIVSYRHLSGLLAHYGEDGVTCCIGPLAVDGLMVMASGALVAITSSKARTLGTRAHQITAAGSAIHDRPEPGKQATTDVTEHVNDRARQDANPGASDHANDHAGLDATADGPTQTPAPKRHAKDRAKDVATRVAKAHAKRPTATHAEIATLAKTSVRSVARHRPRPAPAGDTEPVALVRAETVRVNGTRSELVDVTS